MSDRYEVLSTLGCGATATVYLSRHRKLKTLCAIKCIPRQLAGSSSFPSEAILLKQLHSPGIPVLYDFDEDEHTFYLIEEYVPGESLEAFLLHQSFISEAFLIQIGLQLCDIFFVMHTCSPEPVFYLDLKPEHIIVCGDSIKIIDFGSAIFQKDTTHDISLFGTTEYAAPELLSSAKVSFSSDLFGIGKILDYLSRALQNKCSFKLSRIIQKACAPTVAQRYATVSELKQDLLALKPDMCQTNLLKSIGIVSSHSGVGATHLAVSVVSVLNKNRFSSYYIEKNNSHSLSSMLLKKGQFSEHDGLFCYQHFHAVRHYGEGIVSPIPPSGIPVHDYGVFQTDLIEYYPNETLLFVMGSRKWELEQTYAVGEQLLSLDNVIFVCNYGDTKTAKHLARYFHRPVYCFPLDADPFCITREKERIILELFAIKGGHKLFFSSRNGLRNSGAPLESLEQNMALDAHT